MSLVSSYDYFGRLSSKNDGFQNRFQHWTWIRYSLNVSSSWHCKLKTQGVSFKWSTHFSLINRVSGRKSIDETREKALYRLAVAYGVLCRLGFSEDRVAECLKAIDGVDLDEAYDWVYQVFSFCILDIEHSSQALSSLRRKGTWTPERSGLSYCR